MSDAPGGTPPVHGLHHVTCIAGDPQRNVDFYVGVMGMRLVKRSVNQDVPDTYHLFYADGAGTPGTDLTFFPWPAMDPSRPGAGLAVEVALAVPSASLGYWRERLAAAGIAVDAPGERFGEAVASFRDPDGLHLALVGTDDPRPFVPWEGSPVPAAHQVRGLDAARLWVRDLDATAAALTTLLGFRRGGVEDGWQRFEVGEGGSGARLDVRAEPEARRGTWGIGGVHHVAWRVDDVVAELALRQIVDEAGLRPSPQIDRFWFASVYFKEPGGTLFELATDGPGFSLDEDPAHLGERLILPPWLEPHRAAIEAALPPIDVPGAAAGPPPAG